MTARSHLVDRYRAECEIVALPPRQGEGAVMRIRSGEILAEPPKSRRNLLARRIGEDRVPEGRWIVDLRHRTPSNWSHFLNNHLPLTFNLADAAGRDPDRALLLLPEGIPGYILAAVDLFGLEPWVTNAVVRGDGVAADVPRGALRGARSAWATAAVPEERLARALSKADDMPLPKKFFLSRRDNRMARNSAELEALLEEMGFETIYPETLPVAQQFRLFREAEEIVSIHGAGIAPLIHCRPGKGPARFLEILPAGLMSDAFREMAGHAGTAWVGVRGRLKPQYIAPAYELDKPMRQFSFDDFEIDPVSIRLAWRMFEQPVPAFAEADLNLS